MKMVLASTEKFLLDKGYDLLGLPRDKLKIGIIDTAFKVSEDSVYIEYIADYYRLMNASGIDFKQFDLKGKNEKEILDFFADRNVIQVVGGNVFYLLKVVKETGFDLILRKLLDDGLYYVGSSAGSYLMCPTIEVAGWKIGRNRYGVTDFTALGYIPFLLKCHFNDKQSAEVMEKVQILKYPLKTLRNDQCLFIENEKISLVGSNKEMFV